MNKNHYSLLTIEPNFVPSDVIFSLMSHKSSDYSKALVRYDDTQTHSDHRKTKWLTLPPDVHSKLHQSISQVYDEHLKSTYKSDLKFVEPPQFLRYDVDEHYDCHNDSESWMDGKLKRVVERDVSVLLYLNDDFEGGQIEFTQLGLTLKPKAGMLLAFPSYLEFEHRVHPVTKGTRYTIVSWIATEERIYARPYDKPRGLPRTWTLPDPRVRSQVLQ